MTEITMISFEEACRRLLRYAGTNRVLRRGFSRKKVEAEIEKRLAGEAGETETGKKFWSLYKILVENVSDNPKLRQRLEDMMSYVRCLVEFLPGDPWPRQVLIDVFGVSATYRSKKLWQWENYNKATEELLVQFQEIIFGDPRKVTNRKVSALLRKFKEISRANNIFFVKVVSKLEGIIKK